MKQTVIRNVIIGILALLFILALVVAIIYFWPVRTKGLQTAVQQPHTYAAAVSAVANINKVEESLNLKPDCQTTLLTHGNKTAKTVVMLHGITVCPSQYKALSKVFYDAGYNVYIPRISYHGTQDPREHAKITAQELVDYVNSSLNIADGLGDDMGVVGLSGGGMLGTWAAEYRTDVHHLLALSPFYEPAAKQAPKWQLPFLEKLYGYHLLPDRFSNESNKAAPGFSYYALANFLIVAQNYKAKPTNPSLKSIALVISGSDDQIDLDLAKSIPSKIATVNNLPLHSQLIPADWQTMHDIVDPSATPGVAKHQDQLYPLYFDFYEGRDHSLPGV